MTRPVDDTTKPSRLKRRRKKRWKIAHLIEIGLTDCARVSILYAAGNKSAGISTPRNKGEKSPQPYVAFLCASFSAALCRVYSVMAGLFGQAQAWPVPLSGSTNPLKPVARRLVPMGGGYSLYKGATA